MTFLIITKFPPFFNPPSFGWSSYDLLASHLYHTNLHLRRFEKHCPNAQLPLGNVLNVDPEKRKRWSEGLALCPFHEHQEVQLPLSVTLTILGTRRSRTTPLLPLARTKCVLFKSLQGLLENSILLVTSETQFFLGIYIRPCIIKHFCQWGSIKR